MPAWEHWVIGLSIAVVALAFAALVVFLILTLNTVRVSLKETDKLIRDTNQVVVDIERKIHSFDPIFKQVSKFGHSIEHAAETVEIQKQEKVDKTVNTLMEVVEWGVLGASLWKKFMDKRR